MGMGRRYRTSDQKWRSAETIVYPALAIAPPTFLSDLRKGFDEAGVPQAVAEHDDAPIFDWIMSLVPLQGISDANAISYARSHGHVRWTDVDESLRSTPSCPKLRTYWDFHACSFKRGSWSCSETGHLQECPLPMHQLRKGLLNQAAYSLLLFLRDVCEGDFVSWIDERLRAADATVLPCERGKRMRAALLDPLRHIIGISDKLWSMILADLLLGADPRRERWLSTGSIARNRQRALNRLSVGVGGKETGDGQCSGATVGCRKPETIGGSGFPGHVCRVHHHSGPLPSGGDRSNGRLARSC